MLHHAMLYQTMLHYDTMLCMCITTSLLCCAPPRCAILHSPMLNCLISCIYTFYIFIAHPACRYDLSTPVIPLLLFKVLYTVNKIYCIKYINASNTLILCNTFLYHHTFYRTVLRNVWSSHTLLRTSMLS